MATLPTGPSRTAQASTTRTSAIEVLADDRGALPRRMRPRAQQCETTRRAARARGLDRDGDDDRRGILGEFVLPAQGRPSLCQLDRSRRFGIRDRRGDHRLGVETLPGQRDLSGCSPSGRPRSRRAMRSRWARGSARGVVAHRANRGPGNRRESRPARSPARRSRTPCASSTSSRTCRLTRPGPRLRARPTVQADPFSDISQSHQNLVPHLECSDGDEALQRRIRKRCRDPSRGRGPAAPSGIGRSGSCRPVGAFRAASRRRQGSPERGRRRHADAVDRDGRECPARQPPRNELTETRAGHDGEQQNRVHPEHDQTVEEHARPPQSAGRRHQAGQSQAVNEAGDGGEGRCGLRSAGGRNASLASSAAAAATPISARGAPSWNPETERTTTATSCPARKPVAQRVAIAKPPNSISAATSTRCTAVSGEMSGAVEHGLAGSAEQSANTAARSRPEPASSPLQGRACGRSGHRRAARLAGASRRWR